MNAESVLPTCCPHAFTLEGSLGLLKKRGRWWAPVASLGDEGISPVGWMADSSSSSPPATLKRKKEKKEMNVCPASNSINWPSTIFSTNFV